MRIKLKSKENPIPPNSMWCFRIAGYDPDIIEQINSGKSVEVDSVPKPALEFIMEVNKQQKKEAK